MTGCFNYPTLLLGIMVREKQLMSPEEAAFRLTPYQLTYMGFGAAADSYKAQLLTSSFSTRQRSARLNPLSAMISRAVHEESTRRQLGSGTYWPLGRRS